MSTYNSFKNNQASHTVSFLVGSTEFQITFSNGRVTVSFWFCDSEFFYCDMPCTMDEISSTLEDAVEFFNQDFVNALYSALEVA